MNFIYSKHNLNPDQNQLQRRLEMIPGLISWGILITLTTASILLPFGAAIAIIAFYLFWLMRLLYMTLFLVLSYGRLHLEQTTDWMARVHGIDNLESFIKQTSPLKGISNAVLQRELNHLRASKSLPCRSSDIYHLVIFPIIKEGLDIVEPAVDAIKKQDFPSKQIIVVFAIEERAEHSIKNDMLNLCALIQPHFAHAMCVFHPSDIPGEARVKGANVTFAAKQASSYLKSRNIAFDHVIASCFDADTVVSPNYFACLTYHFMVTPNRQQASFQPIPVYHNNIWHVPGFARVIETGSSFFQLIEATNPEKLVTFSSHSMSFKALVDVDYWPVDMISDDSAIFWKCYIHYEGKYQAIPMYVTLSMDVASGGNWWKTIQSVYKQKRRWAWGVENFPIVMRAFLNSNKIPLWEKIRHGFKLLEANVSWATWGFILSIIGWLPIIFARKEFAASVVYYNVPDIANTIFNLGLVCFIISICLSLALLPKTDMRYSWLKKIGFALEWLSVPIILVFLSALPALDAQTRLMRGKYLEFWVTDKQRKK